MKSPKKKDMSFFQAVKYFQLEPYGDADKDNVPNMFDCRPFDPDKHFLKFSDLKQKLGTFNFGKQKPIAETRTPLSRSPEKSEYKLPKQVYLYVKSEGKWIKVGQFDKGSALLRQSVEQLYKKGVIEKHVVTGSPNDERKLNRGEKLQKVISGTVREARKAKKHFVETAPKAMKSYQQRIGLGETAGEAKAELRSRISEGLEIKSPREKIPIRAAPEMEMEEPEPMEMEEIPIQEGGIEIDSNSDIAREIQAPRKGMPPYSKGWAGSIGGSRPYRPVPYKPTGKIWKPERIHNPNPKIPTASFNMWRPPEQRHDLNPKMPVTTFKFMR